MGQIAPLCMCHPKGCVFCTVIGLKLSPHITQFCLKFGIKFGEESSPKISFDAINGAIYQV